MRSTLCVRLLASGMAATLAAVAISSAHAQVYPAKPVRIIVGQPPGGSQDTLGRGMSLELAKIWGQPVVVENRPGAGDVIAATVAVKSAPDGYTIFFSTSTNMNAATFMRRNLPYDPVKDFLPVVGLAQTYSLLVVSTKLQAKTVTELIALARAKPGVLNYGSFGVGSAVHIDGEAFARVAGVHVTHVPYKGGSALINALLTGEVDFAFSGMTAAVPFVQRGRLRGLAYSSIQRSSALPQVPTLAEAGVEWLDSPSMFVLYVPTGTPQAVMDRIAADASQARAMPSVRDKIITASAMDELPLQGQALAARLQQSRENFASRIKGLDINLD